MRLYKINKHSKGKGEPLESRWSLPPMDTKIANGRELISISLWRQEEVDHPELSHNKLNYNIYEIQKTEWRIGSHENVTGDEDEINGCRRPYSSNTKIEGYIMLSEVPN
ncbi:hypothetical protein EVAR_97852_1 [Eumeta japonica]|uniref:Uncharacterized protein n=1 Tax=Eumeta variegata TaxID=151549 RepID=A0A4C1WZY9_EUMVA|nr:hypothetical protein EVAR_97852_1 [Eumeta japonica]